MNEPAPARCDVAIVGGGMVGAALALALADTPVSVALIEAVAPETEAQPSFDDRTTALGNGARRILATLGVWDSLAPLSAPIRQIHVSDAGHFGFARLNAADHDLEAFGYALRNWDLGSALWRALRQRSRQQVFMPARVLAAQLTPERAELQIESNGARQRLDARLVVAADGAHSLVKQAAGIESDTRDYQQVAVVGSVACDRPARGTAYERFTATGPLALLPRHDQSFTVVWTLPAKQAAAMQSCDELQFCRELQTHFGWRAGRFLKAGRRASYPLSLVRAEQVSATRVAVIGNAAQSLHPVAAQGFNLGLRDAAQLAELIVGAADPGAPALLAQYAELRAADRRGMIGFTDTLVRLFSSSRPGTAALRSLALLLFDVSPPAKQALGRLSWGFGASLPRLARGLSLS